MIGKQNTKNYEEEAKRQMIDDMVDEDENLFELEIKNLDTNEVFKMHIPIGSGENTDEATSKSLR
jgi:hypothetical protein